MTETKKIASIEQEIEVLRKNHSQTLRPTVQSLEDILFTIQPVLDHGFIRVIDYMGDDNAITQAARVSYGSGTKSTSSTEGLIRYLMRHVHTTPFEMCEIKFHLKMPIFIARQWLRHRMASVNEYSARYSILDKEFYLPAPEHICQQSTNNKQGRSEMLSDELAKKVLKILQEDCSRNHDSYNDLISDDGRYHLARELARINLTLNTYTQFYWKIDLHNLFHFLRLRIDHHAQFEIRAFAEQVAKVVKSWVPLAYGAFVDYKKDAFNLSGPMLAAIRDYVSDGQPIDRKKYKMSEREALEFNQATHIPLMTDTH